VLPAAVRPRQPATAPQPDLRLGRSGSFDGEKLRMRENIRQLLAGPDHPCLVLRLDSLNDLLAP